MIVKIDKTRWRTINIICASGTLDRVVYKELTEATLKKWAKMTDENLHVEVRAEIADFFEQKDRAIYFREQVMEWYCKEKVSRRHVNTQIYCDITTIMLQEIKITCGEKVYNLVNQCL